LATLNLSPEMKLLWRFIYKGDGNFQEKADYRTVTSLPGGGVTSIGASAVTFVPVGTIAAADVQNAIEELDTEKAAVGQTMYIGTTQVAINRASATLNLAGIGTFGCGAITSTGILTLSATATSYGQIFLGGASANGSIDCKYSCIINIDAVNTQTDRQFVVAHNGYGQSGGTSLLTISEDGSAVFAGALSGITTLGCGAITSSGVSTFNSFLQPLISEVNNTQRKITCSLTTAEGDMGVAGTYIVSIGYADTGAPYACRYGTYTLNLCKYQSGTWQAKWTLLGTLSAYDPTIACVETSNTSTQLTLTIGVTPAAGHTVGNYSVLKVGGNTGTLNPVWAIANA
jgi:hypothetical protein